MNLFPQILFGHILGDYFLQSRWMAIQKSSDSLICAAHSFLCALCVMAFVGHLKPGYDGWAFFFFAFATHFIIDRFSLGERWLKMINGRTLFGFIQKGHQDLPYNLVEPNEVNTYKYSAEATPIERQHWVVESLNERAMNYRILQGAFAAVVYTVLDNATHLMLYYYGYLYFSN